ncbi:MAG: hypothetical protein K2X47_16705 [Bdellovibrionales bacterium]|nr:hypothetical protein [Bdellovibrionales bacterium]
MVKNGKGRKIEIAMQDRRAFLTKAGLLLGAVGAEEALKLDLLSKMARNIVPTANAATAVAPKGFGIEIVFRDGVPFSGFGGSQSMYDLVMAGNLFPNFPYAANALTRAVSTAGREMYVPTASAFNDPEVYNNLVLTTGFAANQNGHSNQITFRGHMFNRPTQVLAAASAQLGQSVIPGVNFGYNQGRMMNSLMTTSGKPVADFAAVATTAQLSQLFARTPLRLSMSEVNLVNEAAGRLSKLQMERMRRRLASADDVDKAASDGNKLVVTDLSQALNSSAATLAAKSGFADATMNFQGGGGGTVNLKNLGPALASIIAAMKNNLIRGATITVSHTDWHGFRGMPEQGTTEPRDMYMNVSRVIAAAWKEAKASPHPIANGKTLASDLFIVGTSEFGRTLQLAAGGNDNGDGNSGHCFMISENVNPGFYGSHGLAQGQQDAENRGFDPVSGISNAAQTELPAASLYNMIAAVAGISERAVGGATPTAVIKATG